MAALAGNRLVATFKRERGVLGVIKSHLTPRVAFEVALFACLPQVAFVHIIFEVTVDAIISDF